MNIADIMRLQKTVSDVVKEENVEFNIPDFKAFKKWRRNGWAVIDITTERLYFRPRLTHFHHLPYGKRQIPEDAAERKKVKLLNGQDFTVEFKKFFKDCDSVKFILLHSDRDMLADAIEGLFLLGRRKDFKLAVFVPGKNDFPKMKH